MAEYEAEQQRREEDRRAEYERQQKGYKAEQARREKLRKARVIKTQFKPLANICLSWLTLDGKSVARLLEIFMTFTIH
jgi:hypothetical protein